jgi:hypothetical protein
VKRNPVLMAMSLLAVINALCGLAAFSDVVGTKTAGFLLAFSVALQLGVQYWLRGQVTPLSDPRDNLGRPMSTRPM